MTLRGAAEAAWNARASHPEEAVAQRLLPAEQWAESFYAHIAHGDEEHRAWLKRETEAWFLSHLRQPVAGQTVPEGATSAQKVALDIAKWFVNGDRPDEWKLKEWAESLDRDAIAKAYEDRALHQAIPAKDE